MFENIRISHRLLIMATFSAAVFIASIAIGLMGLQKARDSLKSVYEDRTIPLYNLGKISDLMQHNYIETLLALQHNPDSATHLQHDHQITVHTNNIHNAKTKIDSIWNTYMQTYLTEEEKALATDFVEKRKRWVGKLSDTVSQLEKGNFQPEVTIAFLKAGREDQGAANAALDKLLTLQTAASKTEYDSANSNFISTEITFGVLSVIWVLGSAFVFYSTIHHINTAIRETGDAVTAIAQGNFNRPLPHLANDELGELMQKIATMRSSLQELIIAVRGEINNLTRSAVELTHSAQHSANISDNQSNSASTMAAAIEELTASISEVENHAVHAGEITQTSASQSEKSSRIINDAASELSRIAIAVNTTATTIQELEGLSEQITSIVNVIKSIADQTNLLALNAAIEAARAGEQGRGFSVVADEVRTLAGRTSNSTQEITSMIQRIQIGTQRAVKEMNESVARVNEGVTLANSAGESVSDIRNNGQQVVNVVSDISNALREQTIATKEISKRVEQIAGGAEQSSVSVAHTAAAAQKLENIAQNLGALTQRFKTD